MNWLDTETKAILHKEPDSKLAPPKTAEFALSLLRNGSDHQRIVRAIRRIKFCNETEAEAIARKPVPATISTDLTEEESLLGQFEFICCDSIAVFLRSEVLLDNNQAGYLKSVFGRLLKSSEFSPTKTVIANVPPTEEGQRFLDQFLGMPLLAENVAFPRLTLWVPLKKARIMKHWAARIGADVTFFAPSAP